MTRMKHFQAAIRFAWDRTAHWADFHFGLGDLTP